MRHSTTLLIETPCGESWGWMKPEADGRICGSCQKVVQDFTAFSDAELVTWFEQHSGPVCGRLRDDQMGIRLYAKQPANAVNRLRGWVRWAIALVLGWQTARAQTDSPVSTERTVLPTLSPINGKQALVTGRQLGSIVFLVTGQVVGIDGQPIPQAIISKEGIDERSVQTDQDGRFSIPVYTSNQAVDTLTLRIVGNGWQRVVISTKNESAPLLIKMDRGGLSNETISAGGITVIHTSKRPSKSVMRRKG